LVLTLTDVFRTVAFIASCCNEAFKIATSSAAFLDNYFMLIGTDGIYSYTFQHEQREDCPVCGDTSLEISISRDWTVENLIEMLEEKQGMCVSYYIAVVVFTNYAFLAL
jgi:hypothetical protein